MQEFKVPVNKSSGDRRDRTLRLILWGIIVALLVITLFAVYVSRSASPQLNTLLVWVAGILVVATVATAHFSAFRHGVEELENTSAFVLNESYLVRRRARYPDVRIGFSEISALYERQGSLLVESAKAHKRIAIPAKVEGFAALRQELLKHGEIRILPPPSAFTVIPGLALLVCWVLVAWSKDVTAVKVAGAAGLLLLGWECFLLYRKLRFSPHRILVWSVVTVSWLGMVAVLYFRLVWH